MKTILNFLLNLASALFWMLLMLGFSGHKMTFVMICCALLHECGHILALCIINKDFSLPMAVTSGFRIKTNFHLSYKEEILIAACGPMMNLIFFLIFFPFAKNFAVINLATAISNLLPLKDFDGYKIIYDISCIVFGFEISERIMELLSICVASLMVFLSLFMIMFSNGGYWIFFIFFIVLVRQILFLHSDTKIEHLRDFESF